MKTKEQIIDELSTEYASSSTKLDYDHWLEEKLVKFIQQNTLNRDKVKDVLKQERDFEVYGNGKKRYYICAEDSDIDEIADAICSLSLPAMSEEEIDKMVNNYGGFDAEFKLGGIAKGDYRNGIEDAINQLTNGRRKIKDISIHDKIKMYQKRYPNIMMGGFNGKDLRQAYFSGIEDTIEFLKKK